MSSENSFLETGVDKLVTLIRAKKRISLQEAAKHLGVGTDVVEEWADFLEEEGLLSMEYKFSNAYLVEKKLSKDEVKTKEKEFHSKKEGFVRKAEVTLSMLDRESEGFSKFKARFEELKKQMGSDLVAVENQVRELEKLENMKRSIDGEIMQQEKEFNNKITQFHTNITKEQQKFAVIANNINLEEEKLDRQKIEALSLREKEINIRMKLNQFLQDIVKIKKAIGDEEILIEGSEKRIVQLKDMATSIKTEILDRKNDGTKMIKESETLGRKIFQLQKEILEKVTKNKEEIGKRITHQKGAADKFKLFFDKKAHIDELIKDMSKQKDKLELELVDLIKKARAFHLGTDSQELKGHVKELEKKLNEINKGKAEFEKEAQQLQSLLKE